MRSLPVDQKNIVTEIFGQSEARILIVSGINWSDKRRTIMKGILRACWRSGEKPEKKNTARANDTGKKILLKEPKELKH